MKKLLLLVLSLFSLNLIANTSIQGCIACHGQEGISANPLWPNLNGQGNRYLLKQIHDFKEGIHRPSAIMQASLANLTEEELIEITNLYAKMPPNTGKTPRKYLARGEALYRGGDRRKGIPACIACHGPKGRGNLLASFPLLSGQNAPYTLEQLKLFKKKKRKNDLNNIMQDITEKMSVADMKALAYYIQGLH